MSAETEAAPKPEEASNGVTQDGAGKANEGEDVKIDFGKKKSKKTASKTKKEAAEAATAARIGEGIVDGSGEPFHKGRTYDYIELLRRLFEQTKSHNPDLGQRKRYTLKPPQVVRLGTKKSAWKNFAEICNMMNRSQDHLVHFILTEFGTEGSVAGGEQQLVLRGKYGVKNIENILKKYITEFVTCHMCKSANTTLEKDSSTRLQTLVCHACTARRTVSQIKTGYHAVARGERKKAKAAA